MGRVIVDRENVNDEFVIIRKIYKQSGARLTSDESVLEIETSKTVKEICSPEAGTLNIALTEGDEIAVGGLLFEIDTGTEMPRSNPPVTNDEPASLQRAHASGVDAGPAAKRELSRAATELAQRLGVAQEALPEGWVTTHDVLNATATGTGTPLEPASVSTVAQRTDARPHGTLAAPKARFRQERKSLRKRTEAGNLARANGSGTTSMIGIEIPLAGPRLVAPPFIFQESIADLIVFETAKLLHRFPDLNAFHLDDRAIGYFEDVNIGISFDGGHNLKVLALCNADTLSLAQVQAGIEHLLQLYESGASIEDSLLTTSTVTISDLSRSQADFMLPLLNTDQSLIIGISRRGSNGFALHAAFDHRVSEGLQVAQLLGELRDRIQSHHHLTSAAAEDSRSPSCSACGQRLQQELRLGRRGLIRVVLAEGADGYLCRNCFDGW
jgi:pyruvate/2-oxoglutarate dehydrogenase complex dihydrolipoamide acyltransferase (E2) component